MFEKLFLDHPKSVGESYFVHMGMAFGFGGRMLLGGLACLIHGLFPAFFERTGSNTIRHLHDRMVVNRVRNPALAASASASPAPHASGTP